MSDTKKKANGDSVSTTTASKGSKFADKFSKFINLCTEMRNDPAGALDYEKTVEENVTLKSTLKKRDAEVNSLKAEVEQLKQVGIHNLEGFGKKYAEFDARLKEGDSSKRILGETQDKLDKVKKELKRVETENKQLGKKARDTETALKKAERELSATQAECSDLQISLKAAQKKIKFYCEDSLTTVDLPHVGVQFEAFAEKCHQTVMECFEPCQAPPMQKSVSSVLAYLDRYPGYYVKPQLTAYTTVSARLMRCAAAELVIANAMVNHIFTDIYIPGEVDRQKAVSSTLELLGMKSPRRESLVRCQLLEEYKVDAEILSSVRQAAFEEVREVLDGLLPAGDPRDKFHAKLDGLLGEALALWRPLQKSKSRVSAHLSVAAKRLKRDEDAYPDYDWPNFQGPGALAGPGLAGSQPVLLLSPLIGTSEGVVCPPTALWSDQGAFIDACDEASEHRLSVAGSVVGAVDSTRPSAGRRRMSMSMSTGGRMPTSPTSSLPPAGAMNSPADVSSSRLVPSRRTENGIASTGRDR